MRSIKWRSIDEKHTDTNLIYENILINNFNFKRRPIYSKKPAKQ